jgi:hypothetical protein
VQDTRGKEKCPDKKNYLEEKEKRGTDHIASFKSKLLAKRNSSQ